MCRTPRPGSTGGCRPPRSAWTAPSPIGLWSATTPMARCPGGSPPRSPCSTRGVPGLCSPRSTTATRRACMRSRCTRARPNWSSRRRRTRPSAWRSREATDAAHPSELLRVGYLGPEGTFTHEALSAACRGASVEIVPLPTIYETVMAVHDRLVDRALVPIENSLEGSVSATLDALAMETDDVAIVGEVVHPIRQCLIARTSLELSEIETVVSHPQASGQCARFIRTRLPQAQVIPGSSTAEAVRIVAQHEGPWAALGNRLAAERYGCQVLRAGVEDLAGNETRFVWLARTGAAGGGPGQPQPPL